MKALTAVLGFVVAASISAAVRAAMLEPIQGDIRINRGAGYIPVNSPVELKSGDRVLVGSDGSATLVYSDCCSVEGGSESLLTVGTHSPCGAKDEPYRSRFCKLVRPIGPAPLLGLATAGLLGGGLAAAAGNANPPAFIPPVCISNC